ncbi:MAG: IS3 family transposase [Planctomycetota bacterium]
MKYAWIQQHRDSFPIATMCRVLQVSRSGFYQSHQRQPSERQQRTARIHQAVRQVHQESAEIYGSYKIARRLQEDPHLESACRNTVANAMRQMGLRSRVSKKFKPTTTVSDPSKKPAANLLDQVFDAEAPNRKWVADITYLPTAAGWVYLAVVLDLFSRKVVGWSTSESLATSLVSDALRQAIENLAQQPASCFTTVTEDASIQARSTRRPLPR